MSSILVVEDNPVNMRLVRLLLRTHGYQCMRPPPARRR